MTVRAVVVDTNLVFSALIPKASSIRDLFFEGSIVFFAPDFLLTEIFKHKDKIIKHSKLNEEEFYKYFSGITGRIQFVPLELINFESRQKAYDLCKDVDEKDIPFIALAIELKIPFWTGDKKLKEGLKSKGFSDFFPE